MKKEITRKIIIDGLKGILEITQNKITYKVLFDIKDIELIKSFDWRINKDGYVYCGHCLLHRLIKGFPPKKHVHHKNLNKLDNRRCNLSVLSPSAHHKIHNKIMLKKYFERQNKIDQENADHWFRNLDPILKKNIQNLITGHS